MNKKEILEIGGVKAIIQCLQSKDVQIVREATRAIRNLAFNGTSSSSFTYYRW